jgi:hypothetical protein
MRLTENRDDRRAAQSEIEERRALPCTRAGSGPHRGGCRHSSRWHPSRLVASRASRGRADGRIHRLDANLRARLWTLNRI